MNNHRVMYFGTARGLPFADQLRAASIAGCDALTIGPFEYLQVLAQGIPPKDMLRMAADAGVKITHLDPLARWLPAWLPDPTSGDFPVAVLDFDPDAFFRMADVLEVESFTAVGTFPENSVSFQEIVDRFGQLCKRAKSEGLRCDLEFVPLWGIPDLQMAWEIIKTVNAPNSGIMFDFYHYTRSHSKDELLGSIPGDRITGVQFDDGAAALPAGRSLYEDTIMHRCPPGEGEFRIKEIVAILRRIGGLNNIGPEIFSAEFNRMNAEQIGEKCRRAMEWALAE